MPPLANPASREPIARPGAVWLLAALVIVAGWWAHAPGLDGVLVLDDVRAIVRNQSITSLSTALSPPGESTVAGRPIANLSLALNYALTPADERDWFDATLPGAPPDAADRVRRNVRAYHVGNLVIHLTAALLLFGVVRRTLLTSRLRERFTAVADGVAGIVALLWVVHPQTTGAVTYVVQRVESLMSLFLLLTLYAAIRAADARPRRMPWLLMAVVACALGMGVKETMVVAPIVVAAWLWIFRSGDDRGVPWGLVAGLAATWVVLAVLVAGETRAPSLGSGASTVWRYLITQADVLIHYVAQALFPTTITFLYDWLLAESLAQVRWQVLLVGLAVVVTATGVWRRHPLAFPAATFFLVLAPSSSLLPILTEVAATHRMYLPLASVIVVVVSAIWWVGRRVGVPTRAGTMAAGLGAVGLALVLGLQTRDRGRLYASEEALWQDTVARRPQDLRPRLSYGIALARVGKLAEAEAQLQEAVRIAPEDALARVRLGSVLAQTGKPDAAIPHLERAIANRPDDPAAYRLLGQIYADRGQEALAVQHLGRALISMGNDPELLVRLAVILADARDPAVRDGARAADLAQRAVALTQRRNVLALTALALAHGQQQQWQAMAATAREALALAQAQGASPALRQRLQQMSGTGSFAPMR